MRMITAREWALKLPPDVLEHPMPLPMRLDYAEKIIKQVRDEAFQFVIDELYDHREESAAKYVEMEKRRLW